MKRSYLDTSVVVKIVVAEPLSQTVQRFLQERRLAVPWTKLIEIETLNTLYAKYFREEITRSQLRECRNLIGEFLKQGRFFRPALALDEFTSETLKRMPAITGATGCRTLDVMHVASAKLLGCQEFVSTDGRQLQAAHAARLKPIDVTSWSPGILTFAGRFLLSPLGLGTHIDDGKIRCKVAIMTRNSISNRRICSTKLKRPHQSIRLWFTLAALALSCCLSRTPAQGLYEFGNSEELANDFIAEKTNEQFYRWSSDSGIGEINGRLDWQRGIDIRPNLFMKQSLSFRRSLHLSTFFDYERVEGGRSDILQMGISHDISEGLGFRGGTYVAAGLAHGGLKGGTVKLMARSRSDASGRPEAQFSEEIDIPSGLYQLKAEWSPKSGGSLSYELELISYGELGVGEPELLLRLTGEVRNSELHGDDSAFAVFEPSPILNYLDNIKYMPADDSNGIVMVRPAEGRRFSYPSRIRIRVAAGVSGIEKIRVFATSMTSDERILLTTLTKFPYEFVWDRIGDLADRGRIVLGSEALDIQGTRYVSEDVSIEISQDFYSPKIEMMKPRSRQAVLAGESVDVRFAVKTADGSELPVKVFVDGKLAGEAGYPLYSTRIPALTAGNHFIYGRVEDALGNVSQTPTVGFAAASLILRVPRISEAGTFRVEILGVAEDERVVIQKSSDLESWEDVTSFDGNGGPMSVGIGDSDKSVGPHRFFRARTNLGVERQTVNGVINRLSTRNRK